MVCKGTSLLCFHKKYGVIKSEKIAWGNVGYIGRTEVEVSFLWGGGDLKGVWYYKDIS